MEGKKGHSNGRKKNPLGGVAAGGRGGAISATFGKDRGRAPGKKGSTEKILGLEKGTIKAKKLKDKEGGRSRILEVLKRRPWEEKGKKMF